MTTCVNQEKKGYAGKAVSATLAGVLAVGMVPAAAFAEAGDGAADDASVETLATAGTLEDVAGGSVIAATDSDGVAISDLTNVEFTTGSKNYLVPTSIKTLTGVTVNSDDADAENYVVGYYIKASNQNPASGTDAANDYVMVNNKKVYVTCVYDVVFGETITDASTFDTAGQYYAVVNSKEGVRNASTGTAIGFKVVAKSLQGATIQTSVDEATITYDGATKYSGLAVVLDGKALTSTDYTVAFYKKNDTTAAEITAASVIQAGDYIAAVTGKNSYDGSYVEIPFTVNKLDLSTAKVVLADAYPSSSSYTVNEIATSAATSTKLPAGIKSIAGIAWDAASGETIKSQINTDQLLFTGGVLADGTKTGLATSGKAGTFTYTITADSKATNVTGTKTIEVIRYGAAAAFYYNGTQITAGTATNITTKAFDASKVAVYETADQEATVPYTISYEKVTSASGASLETTETVTDTTAPGTYYAVITAKSSDLSYGGSERVKFEVKATQVDSNKIFVTYNGTLKTGTLTEPYTGEDILKSLSVQAFDTKGKEVAASEFEFEVKKNNKEVDSIVDAGEYTVTVKVKDNSSYTINGDAKLTVTVEAVNTTATTGNADIRLAGEPTLGGQEKTYAYTGSAITPTFEYDITDTAKKYANDYSKKTWVELPTSAYTVTYYKADKDGELTDKTASNKVAAPTEAGTYYAVLTDVAKDTNYVANAEVMFTISDSKYFIDVPVGTWYYDNVYKAANLKYMTGYDGTRYFGPNDNLTRAQAVVVLYKMAGGTTQGEADAVSSKWDTYASQFADVDQSGWYAQALGWAVKAGIVTGTSSTTFEPSRDVTRQEFALMLQRYAKANAKDVTADTSVLKTYADANAVDSWATDGVAWAVDNKIMGQGVTVLNPTGTITRAEVATMAVRYQPKALDVDKNLLNPTA
jgi:hypothetical protein